MTLRVNAIRGDNRLEVEIIFTRDNRGSRGTADPHARNNGGRVSARGARRAGLRKTAASRDSGKREYSSSSVASSESKELLNRCKFDGGI